MIELDSVSHSFGDVPVLAGVDLAVDRGELVGLVGPNGAGKTTLLQTINGVLAPDSGAVVLDGESSDDLSARAVSRRLATVPQDPAIGFAFTAEQIVEMGRTPHYSRLEWALADDAVDAAFEQTGTEHLRDRRIDELSGGERQLVLLARALAQEAPGLLLDEPTASLDINHQVQVLEQVRDLVRDGRAALAAIHDLDLAARYCDRLVLLADGHIRASGRPAAVLADDALAAAFDVTTAVSENPATATPQVTALLDPPDRDVAVHVVGNGRTAARAVGALWRAGVRVSVGPVPAGDVAAETAASLATDVVTVAPFTQPGDDARRAVNRLIGSADACLVLPSAAAIEPAGLDVETPVVSPESGEAEGATAADLVEATLASAGGDAVTADD